QVRVGIDGDSRGSLEVAFSAGEGPDGAAELPIGVEDKDFPRARIRNVDVIVSVYRGALRRLQNLMLVVVSQELVRSPLKIEDVDTRSAGIGDNHTMARISDNAVRTDEAMRYRRPGHNVENLLPESALAPRVEFGTERPLVQEFAALRQVELWREFGNIGFCILLRRRVPMSQQDEQSPTCEQQKHPSFRRHMKLNHLCSPK